MTQNKRLSHEDVRRDMNLALDNMLGDAARTQLDEHLASSPSDLMQWERLQRVDLMLSNERDVFAPPDFAAKVMASIAAGRQPQPEVQRTDMRTVIALLVVVGLLLPIVLTTMLFVRHLITDPVAQQVLLQQIMFVLRTGVQAIASVFEVVANYVSRNVLVMTVLATSAAVTTLAWGWMIRYFAVRRTQVVYRIPVQAA